jgi:hypothetical protein
MVQGQRRRYTAPALIRLLERLIELDVPPPNGMFGERLGGWLGWTDAIALSAALHAVPAATPSAPSRSAPACESAQRDFDRVRGALARFIADDAEPAADEDAPLAPGPATPLGADGVPAAAFAPYRRRYLARQQSMESGIAALRDRVRAVLAGTSPAMARLAALDAVMEQALGAHERGLMAMLPGLLEKRFERLRATHRPMPGARPASDTPVVPDAPAADTSPPGHWMDLLRRDMQAVLLAELDTRLQPVEGLLAALRTSPPSRHA